MINLVLAYFQTEVNTESENFEEDFASEEVGTKSEDLPQWEKELQDELQVSYGGEILVRNHVR